MMKHRRLNALWLALAVQATLPVAPAMAQGLRIAPSGAEPRAAAPRFETPRSADYIVAVVNSEPITNNEVRSRMFRFAQQLQQQGVAIPAQDEFARQVLERLISERAQLQVARENGMKIDDALVDQAEQTIARQNQVDVAELRRRLAADGLGLSQFREELRDQLLLTRLRERELDSKVKVSDLEVDQYLRDQKNGNDPSTAEINLAHILVALPENATEAQVSAARAKAQRALDRARAGEDFARLVREFSDAAGAASNGGVIGLRTADRYPPVFVAATQSLAAGGVSDIVRTAAGFHVIKVIEKHQGGVANMRTVQNHARHILLRPGPQLSQAAAIARLADFKKRIEARQADFAQLARESSQDASASNGGDLGWANPGLFVPEFEEVVNSLSPGEIADPVVSRFGVHLVQLLERREVALSPREQREAVRNLLREKKLDESYAAWAQEVRGRAYVDYRDPPR